MKNTALIIAAILVLVVGGAGLFAMFNRSPSMIQSESANKKTPQINDSSTMPKVGEKVVTLSENYLQFSPAALDDAENGRRVLFFYANWCPTCKVANEEFLEQSAQLPDDVTVIRVNYNDNDTDQTEKDLAKKYFITYQHTFVQIDAEGNEVKKWNGGEIEELLTNLE